MKKKGCDWINELSELLHHLEECELFPVACPLGCRDEKGEVSRLERRGVETHKTCCPMRSVKCEYCSISVKACDMNGHLEVCEEFPIRCPNKCSEEFRVKRKDKSIHLSQECPIQETECPYSQYGCEVKVQRRNLEQHEKEDIHKHMKLTIHLMQSEVITLQKENGELNSNEFNSQSRVVKLEKKNEELRTKIVNLEKTNEESRSSLKEGKEEHLKLTAAKESDNLKRFKSLFIPMMIMMIAIIIMITSSSSEIGHLKRFQSLLIPMISILGAEGNLEWKISGVKNKISQNEDTYSEPFYVGLYKFQGYVQWVSNDNYVGVFLCIMKGEWDDTLKWPIKYKRSLVLINQLDDNDNSENNYENTEEDLEKFPEGLSKPSTKWSIIGLGTPEFISHADLLQEKYSKDDSIILKISVELIVDLQEGKEGLRKHLAVAGNEEIDQLKKFQSLLIPMVSSLRAKGNLEWKISGVKNKISQNEDTYSDPFYVGLYKFRGWVGWVRHDNHIGLYIYIVKGEWDNTLKWPIRYRRSLVLINQLDAKDNYENNYEITEEDLKKFPKCFKQPSAERNEGFGPPGFISHANLLQEKYSKDDSIILKISLELILDAN